jgi:hypothetical protein
MSTLRSSLSLTFSPSGTPHALYASAKPGQKPLQHSTATLPVPVRCPAHPLPLPPPPPQAPITDAGEIADLRDHGLTERGVEKVRKGDLRCRPPKHYREVLLNKPLPQFRLSTVVDSAKAEDLIMLWAYLTKRGE